MNAFIRNPNCSSAFSGVNPRISNIFAGLDSIRDCIAFPKNNSGRDVMLDAPAALDPSQLDELNLIVDIKE